MPSFLPPHPAFTYQLQLSTQPRSDSRFCHLHHHVLLLFSRGIMVLE